MSTHFAPRTRKIGLTAGIACGKSLVVGYLHQLGVPTLDVDQVVHELYTEDKELQEQIRHTFGPGVFSPTGQVDRRAVGRIAFQDPLLLRQLEAWIHPKVHTRLLAFFETHAQSPLAVAEIPLLFEAQMEPLFDEIWVVRATQEQQIQRLMTHKGYSQAEALTRIQNQLPLDEKLQRATVVIDNTGSPEATFEQVKALIHPPCLPASPSLQ